MFVLPIASIYVYVYIYSALILVSLLHHDVVTIEKGGEAAKMKPFNKLIHNKKGLGVAVMAVVTTVVLLFVGILVMTTFISSVTPNSSWSTSANTTWTNVQSYAWTAIGLVAIGIIILGAVAILSIVRGMGGVGSGGL